MGGPHERFAAFLAWRGWTQQEAADALGVTQVAISFVARGKKLPGRLLANAIERESAAWPAGPIRATEWDALEIARRNARTGTDG